RGRRFGYDRYRQLVLWQREEDTRIGFALETEPDRRPQYHHSSRSARRFAKDTSADRRVPVVRSVWVPSRSFGSEAGRSDRQLDAPHDRTSSVSDQPITEDTLHF